MGKATVKEKQPKTSPSRHGLGNSSYGNNPNICSWICANASHQHAMCLCHSAGVTCGQAAAHTCCACSHCGRFLAPHASKAGPHPPHACKSPEQQRKHACTCVPIRAFPHASIDTDIHVLSCSTQAYIPKCSGR